MIRATDADLRINRHASFALTRLKELLANHQAVAFLGAGASAPIYPLWEPLVKTLAEKARADGRATTDEITQWRQRAISDPDWVLQVIKKRMGEEAFRAIVCGLFASRCGVDGKAYTPVQSAVVRGAFKGIVTTNYDSGVIEARSDEVPWVRSTGYCTLADRDRLGAWYSGDIFEEEDLPILFAHGIHENPDTLVLTLDQYRRAYFQTPLRRVVQHLVGAEHLVFIGFSLSDSWFRFAADETIFEFARSSRPRHIAILPFPPDAADLDAEAERLADLYDCDLLPYATSTDQGTEHARLFDILDSVAVEVPRRAPSSTAVLRSPKGEARDLWAHETTNDHRFAGREGVLSHLDRWAADPTVRTIAVTGMGGQGKTALIGHWLKECRPDRGLDNDPIFYWSLYADRSVRACLSRFLAFSKSAPVRPDASLVEPTIEALKARRLVFVLDGLEVMQERPGSQGYGTLLHDELRELVCRACHSRHRSLMVLTSRFPFADLGPFRGKSLRLLNLESLSPDDGSLLLQRAGVGGSTTDRASISRYFDGHPLALRVMAAVIRATASGDPSRVWDRFKGARDATREDKLEAKLVRLLEFYRNALTSEQRGILSALSLFRYPVKWETVHTLVSKSTSTTTLTPDLSRLVEDGLVLQEIVGSQGVFSCHPVLRDYFREKVLGSNRALATSAAKLLTDVPASLRPRDIGEIAPALDAVAVLLDGGFYQDAHRIFQDRLLGGEVFFTLPALAEGMKCVLGFVADEHRQRDCRAALSRRDYSAYLNMTAYFGCYAGELQHASSFFELAEHVNRSASDTPNLAATLRNLAEVECLRGNLKLARRHAKAAVALSDAGVANPAAQTLAHCQLGFILFLEGKIEGAERHFRLAEDAREGDDRLLGPGEVLECEALLRSGQLGRASALADRLESCNQKREWRDQSARVRLLIGALNLQRRRYKEAGTELKRGEELLRHGHLFSAVPLALVLRARLARRMRMHDEGIRLLDEAWSIAAPRGLDLLETDALIERAWCLLERGRAAAGREVDLASALQDAAAAYGRAKSTGYLWATVEAADVGGQAADALGLVDHSASWRRKASRARELVK